MRVDALPYIARASGLTVEQAATEFLRCRQAALRRNGGRDDTRTYVLAVEAFRRKHPFEISALVMDRSRYQDAGGNDTTRNA